MKKDYGKKDTDHEHLLRSPQMSLPPRVIKPRILKVYDIDLIMIAFMIKGISDLRKDRATDFDFTGLRESFLRKLPQHNLTLNGKSNYLPKEGKILFYMDIIEDSLTVKKAKNIRYLQPDLQRFFLIGLDRLLTSFIENIYPKHLHFILKDSILTPLPFKYVEFYMKAEEGNMGNITADFADGDVIIDSVEQKYKKESGA